MRISKSGHYQALRAEIAERVIFDPDCKNCEKANHFERGVDPHAEGYLELWDRCCWVRPCSSCKQRYPYRWVLKVPLDKFIAWVTDPKNEGVMIDGMRELVPFEEVRGSSRFEFL